MYSEEEYLGRRKIVTKLNSYFNVIYLSVMVLGMMKMP